MRSSVTILILVVAFLLALGLVMLYSSSMTQVGLKFVLRQFIWCLMGCVACVVLARLDYAVLRQFAWVIFVLAILLLVLTLVPSIGIYKNGARRWLGSEAVRFQPSEIGKLAMIIALAWYGERFERQMHQFWRGLVFPGIILAALLGLVFFEPDRGTTVLMATVGAAILLMAGTRFMYLVPPMVIGVIGFAVYLMNNPMTTRRIFAWLYLEEQKEGAAYQAYEAMVALGSGGLFGLGLGNGRQKLGFVPEHHTDFIYSVIGEELGLMATLLVALCYLVFLFCGLRIARRAPDTFGMLLAAGISLLIALQAAINIGVVTSALPNKGLPLPFISYGGSNLMIMLACVGVLISVARRGRTDSDLPTGVAEQREITEAYSI